MFSFMKKGWRLLSTSKAKVADLSDSAEQPNLFSSLEKNLDLLQQLLGNSADIVIRRFMIGQAQQGAAIIFVDGLVNDKMINEDVLRPLMRFQSEVGKVKLDAKNVVERLVTIDVVEEVAQVAKFLDGVLMGNAGLLLEGQSTALLLDVKGWSKRSIAEPDTEAVVKGPRDGFTETLRENTAMLRRRIGNPNLQVDKLVIGEKTRTDIAIVYIRNVADDALVAEVKRRLKGIDTQAILSGGNIEEFIEDVPLSFFTTIGYTERPDVCSARLLEGRVAIFIDGTPVVNTVPCLFLESFQNADDYNYRPFIGTLTRWIRYFAYIVTITLPAAYIALTTYHHELIPTPLLISFAAVNEGTPFPAILEVFAMGIIFEIIREGGIRLPRPIGQTVTIVGALVLGETTMMAGLVGPPMIIVIALAAITSFLVPLEVESVFFMRAVLVILAGILGVYGIIVGLIFFYIKLLSIRSFGVPYLAPLIPAIPQDFKDVLIRAPLWMMDYRPKSIPNKDPRKQGPNQKPKPPDNNNLDEDQQ